MIGRIEMFSQQEIDRILEVFIYEQNLLLAEDNIKYFTYINAIKAADLSALTTKDIDVVWDFLFKWGHMRGTIAPGIRKTATAIEKCACFLQSVRTQDLHVTSMASQKVTIKDLFQELEALVRGVAASKILHLIGPGFFPLWDTAIWKGYNSSHEMRRGCKLIETINVSTDKGNKEVITGAGYCSFMELTKSFVTKHYQILSQIQAALNRGKRHDEQKSLVKIVDEFNVHAAHLPFYYLV